MRITSNQTILLVEDSNEDFEATIRAFKKSQLHNPVFRCENGDQALDYLFSRGIYSDKDQFPAPGIVLLDLNIPGTNGRDVLKAAKSNPETRRIPIIVLTTSEDKMDILHCYDDGANSYIHKPVNLSSFMDAIERLKDYWFEVVVLPKE